MTQNKKYLFSIMSITFPCILGIIAMTANNVPVGIWTQNISIIILLSFITILPARYTERTVKLNYKQVVIVSVILLLLPFLQNGGDEVHRWINVFLFSLNISMIVVPITIVAIYNLLRNRQTMFSLISIIVISTILFLQPDASQLTGFSIAILLCLFNAQNLKVTNTISKILISGILLVFTVLSWRFLDSLQAVNYVEGIFGMLSNISIALYLLGLIAAVMIPVPFIIFPTQKNNSISLCIALYYWAIILSAFFGNFPIPFMGYGISPIIGYFILLWHY